MYMFWAIILVAIILVLTVVAISYYATRQATCTVIIFNDPPEDSMENLTHSEQAMMKQFSSEDFRISPSASGGGGPRFSGGGGGGGGGGHHWHDGGGGGGWSGGWSWPWWREWPDYYWRRPWRTGFWQMYPEYVPTYPLTYYTNDWVAPVTRYTVRIGVKGANHPAYGKGSELGYMISGAFQQGGCGQSGATIELERGKTYEFDVYTGSDCVTGEPRDEPFYFTTDPEGGRRIGDVFSTAPIVNGVLRFTVSDAVPNKFYYQSSKHPNVGGYVYVK